MQSRWKLFEKANYAEELCSYLFLFICLIRQMPDVWQYYVCDEYDSSQKPITYYHSNPNPKIAIIPQ